MEEKYTGPVTVGIELVTPQFAQEALRHNGNNRNLSKVRVDLYKKDMKDGNWSLNGESISFYDNGDLKDGQHRLMAIAESGLSQWMVVVRNIPTKVVIADRGRSRSTCHILEMAGYPSNLRQTNLIGAINMLYRCSVGRSQLTDSEISSFIDKYSQFLVNAWASCTVGSQRPLAKKSPVIAALFCALYNNVPPATTSEFCKVVNTGFCETDKQYSAIVLRNFLLQNDTTGSNAKRIQCFRIAVLAIEDYVAGIPRRRMYDTNKTSKYYSAVRQGVFNLEVHN